MASSSADVYAKVNYCRIGRNFYQGQTLNGKTFGYGTLFDQNHEQFIIGAFRENKLVDIRIAQFSCCNIKKFKNYHLFDCEKENFIAQITVSITNINISESFDKIFKDLCSGSKILKIYEDQLSNNLTDFCNNLEQVLVNVDWRKSDDNKPLEFFDFYQLLTQCSTNDPFELIRKLGTTPVICGDMSHKRAALNNDVIRRDQIFKFTNIIFKLDLLEELKSMLEKICSSYRVCLLEHNFTLLQPHIEALEFPFVFLIRICDLNTFIRSNQVAIEYKIPFDIAKVFQLISRNTGVHHAVPSIMKCYPDLLKALGAELTLLSEELKIPYETLFDELIMKRKPIEMQCDTLNYHLRRVQLSFIRDLLDYYKAGDSLKKKLFSGPHEDYSVHSTSIKSKTISFHEASFKGKVFEDIRIWYDMLDLNIVTMYQYINNTKNYIEDKRLVDGLIVVEFLHNYIDHFQIYSKMVFDIFKDVFQGEVVQQGFCLYELVKILTDVMQSILKNLFEFSCDPSKSDLVKNILRRQIDANSNILENIMLIQKQIDEICL